MYVAGYTPLFTVIDTTIDDFRYYDRCNCNIFIPNSLSLSLSLSMFKAEHEDSAVDMHFEEKSRIKAQAQLAFDRKTSRHLPRNV